MRRTALLRRAPMKRGTRRLGQAARERVRAGGKLAVGRDSATLAAWRSLVEALREAAGGRCESPFCRASGRLEPHHILKRSAGGPDTMDNVVMLCPSCHCRTDAPYRIGRLIVRSVSRDCFWFFIEWRAYKGAPLTDHQSMLKVRVH